MLLTPDCELLLDEDTARDADDSLNEDSLLGD